MELFSPKICYKTTNLPFMNPSIFDTIPLDENHNILATNLQKPFSISQKEFDEIWEMHPKEYHNIIILGKEVKTPRWQQSYGKNYRYTGSRNNALPIPEKLNHFLAWTKENIDDRLNGLLLNWYDGNENHYIGAHRDDTRDLCDNSPIVTISLGEERIFRMRPYKKKGFKDLTIKNGDVVIVPWETNIKWTHEVPAFKKYSGRRISVTLRAYL